ncbi:protein takeout-like [Anoplophora glabripennis]|uniref:protein takeout-like n=1 Tax=Anoplophora glabripennis TaxID=217634 RepID=UPI000873B494|nr:protein takeout-like [Anoplophora glabripennis]
MLALIFAVFFLVSVEGSSHLPPDMKLCHRSDPNFFQCLGKASKFGLRSLANGSKYYGIPPIDPLFVEEIIVKGEPSETVSLQTKYNNVYLHGMSISNAEQKFVLDLGEKCGWVIEALTPLIRMEADYELTGKLLLFQLNGHGRCNITLYNLWNLHTMTCEKYTAEGKTYLKITNYTIHLRPEKLHFDLTNIFPANEQIAAEILKTMNENSLIIFNDIKGGFEQIFSEIHWAMANKLFSKEPINEIFLD